ncbi:MAG: hypothetical protein FJZ86_12010 [Chloroflexi bacterium]|nr:hypothetical protein [Chloroflexota bacterium]
MHLIKFQELDRQSASSVFLTPFDQTHIVPMLFREGKPAPKKQTDKLADAVPVPEMEALLKKASTQKNGTYTCRRFLERNRSNTRRETPQLRSDLA